MRLPGKIQGILIAVTAVVAVLLTAMMSVDVLRHPRSDAEAPPPLWPVPAFTMLDQDGRAVSDRDLRGEVWVAGFFFTRCPLICPQMTSRMAGLGRELVDAGRAGAAVRLVSISLDPANDRPPVMKAYAEAFGAAPPRWLFLVHPEGDRDAVWRLVGIEGFKLTVAEGSDAPGSNPIEHSPRFLLVDRDGMVRDSYDSRDDADMQRLLGDALAVARLPAASEGGGP